MWVVMVVVAVAGKQEPGRDEEAAGVGAVYGAPIVDDRWGRLS